jgi:hypothetical protein
MGPALATAIGEAKTAGLDVLTSNVVVLLAIPAAWVAYRVARKVIAKIG